MIWGWSRHCSLPPHALAPAPQALGKPPLGLVHMHLLLDARKGPCQGWPSCASGQELGKAHTRAESLTPVATGFPVCFITIGVRSLMAIDSPAHLSPSGLPPPWQPCHIHTVLTECSKAASEADPCGWPTCRGGAKTTAELQGL